MKINTIKHSMYSIKNTNNCAFGSHNKENPKKGLQHKAKNLAVLTAAMLSASTFSKADTYTPTNNSEVIYYDINQLNHELVENIKRQKELKEKEKEYEKKWENIPDYKKLTTLFYASLIALLLMNIFTGKYEDKDPPPEKL